MYIAKYDNKFYPRNKLNEEIEKEFCNIEKKISNTFLGISPHAGYFFSLSVAMKTYITLFEDLKSKRITNATFIIFSPSHTGFGNAISTKNYKLPNGTIEIDEMLLSKMKKKFDFLIDYENDHAINYEHALEVQLPIITFLAEKYKINVKYLGFVFEDITKENLALVKEIITLSNHHEYKIVISSDFIHFGYNYDFVPFKENVDENFENLNMKIINHILKIEPEEFLKNSYTVCGKIPIYLALKAFTNLKLNVNGYLIEFTDSSKKWKSFDRVGYASIVFQKSENNGN
ncbi:MAG: AmmeMemoRadiSam system protein B [Candidatus Woesearchaeota archaeon]